MVKGETTLPPRLKVMSSSNASQVSITNVRGCREDSAGRGLRSGQARLGQVRSGQVRSGRVESGQARPGQVRSTRVGSGRVCGQKHWAIENTYKHYREKKQYSHMMA